MSCAWAGIPRPICIGEEVEEEEVVVVVASSPTLGLSLIEISDIYTYAFIWHTERTVHNVHDRDLLSVR